MIFEDTKTNAISDIDATVDSPKIGIFWYDANAHKLFGVYKCNENKITPDASGMRVFPILHKDVWNDLRNPFYNAYGEYVPNDEFPNEENNPVHYGDYTLVPRGRVFSDDYSYLVFAGDWLFESDTEEREAIKSLILREFDLSEDETDFIADEHWNVGVGWGE